MFAKIFALFAMLAVGFAAPHPKPQLVTYSGLDYPAVYSGPSYVSPLSYGYDAAPAPVAYSALPSDAYYLR